jgi:hypothetical protein
MISLKSEIPHTYNCTKSHKNYRKLKKSDILWGKVEESG